MRIIATNPNYRTLQFNTRDGVKELGDGLNLNLITEKAKLQTLLRMGAIQIIEEKEQQIQIPARIEAPEKTEPEKTNQDFKASKKNKSYQERGEE